MKPHELDRDPFDYAALLDFAAKMARKAGLSPDDSLDVAAKVMLEVVVREATIQHPTAYVRRAAFNEAMSRHRQARYVLVDEQDCDWLFGAAPAAGQPLPVLLALDVLADPLPPLGDLVFEDPADPKPPLAGRLGALRHAQTDPAASDLVDPDQVRRLEVELVQVMAVAANVRAAVPSLAKELGTWLQRPPSGQRDKPEPVKRRRPRNPEVQALALVFALLQSSVPRHARDGFLSALREHLPAKTYRRWIAPVVNDIPFAGHASIAAAITKARNIDADLQAGTTPASSRSSRSMARKVLAKSDHPDAPQWETLLECFLG